MVRRALPVLFWLALAFSFVMAVMPHPPQPPGHPSDKFQHIVAFATLTALAIAAYPATHWLRIFAGLAAYGALIEIVQGISALQRTSDWADFAADVMAVAVVLAIGQAARWFYARR